MRLSTIHGVYLATLVAVVHANTEKVIFIAPESARLPSTKPGAQYLDIPSLKHGDTAHRTSLPVAFPQESAPAGRSYWYLLRDLVPAKRYELRLCWSATPTSFRLQTYTIADVFDSPLLIRDLAQTAPTPDKRPSYDGKSTGQPFQPNGPESVLYLHIQAAADYYSSNATLMLHPPDVHVDLILDPFIANIFPTTLLPTAVYILALTIFAWILSSGVWTLIKPRPASKPHTD